MPRTHWLERAITRLEERPRRLLIITVLVMGWLLMPLGLDTNEARYIDQALSIERRGELDINFYHNNTIDKSKVGENYYPSATPGPSFLIVPAVWLADRGYGLLPESFQKSIAEKLKRSGSQASRMEVADIDAARFLVVACAVEAIVCVPLAAVLAVGLWRLLRLFASGGEASTAALSVTILFGTHAAFYLGRIYSHAAAACVMTWALLLLGRAREGRLGDVAVAGLLSALLPMFEYPLGISAAILGLFAVWRLRRPRPILAFAAGAALPAAAFMAYHWALFGGPFTPAHHYFVGGDVHASGIYGVHAPSVSRLLLVLFSPYRGFFVYSFLLLPALVGGVSYVLRQRGWPRPVAVTALCLSGAQLAIIASYTVWTGGMAWGARFLTVTVPLLGLGLVPLWEGRRRLAIASLAIAGMLINVLAAASRYGDAGLDHPFPMGFMLANVVRRGLNLPIVERLGAIAHFDASAWPVQLLTSAILALVAAGLGILWRRAMARDAGVPSAPAVSVSESSGIGPAIEEGGPTA